MLETTRDKRAEAHSEVVTFSQHRAHGQSCTAELQALSLTVLVKSTFWTMTPPGLHPTTAVISFEAWRTALLKLRMRPRQHLLVAHHADQHEESNHIL